jgi:beta-phosphoglucomutase family hydrolase
LAGWAAVVFDLDGVLLDTVSLHRRAWADLFAAYFTAAGLTPPYGDADYLAHIDGRPRYEGVRALLASRGTALPAGDPADPPDRLTVCGLGNRKNVAFQAALAAGVPAYPETGAVLAALRRRGCRLAVASSSRNARAVLAAADLTDSFETVVDGETAAADGLRGKPAPDYFLAAARCLGLPPAQTIVVEDALAGVAAARAGGFGLVIGVDRGAGADLRGAGADIVLPDLRPLAEEALA